MKNLAIIPARGGSKRIPRKNIKPFLGKPMIAYAIENALKSGLFEEVMVSTDDDEIAEIALKYGAKVPFLRSKKNSDDFATTFDVIEEVISCYTERGEHFNEICCIYACTPLLNSTHLVEAYTKLIEGSYSSVYPVVEYSTPIQRSLRINSEKLEFCQPEYLKTRSQDLEKRYFDPGQFYWMNTKKIVECKSVFTDNTGYIVYDEQRVQDIDNESDWSIAEMKFKLLNL